MVSVSSEFMSLVCSISGINFLSIKKNFKDSHPFFHFVVAIFIAILIVIPCAGTNLDSDELAKANRDASLPPNVVFIVIDSLRRDHLGTYNYFRKTSDIIDRLCREGVLFSDVISQSSQTAVAMASLFTGLYPYKHGIQCYSFNHAFDPDSDEPSDAHSENGPFLSDSLTTLAEKLHSAGFQTIGLNENPWLRSEFNFNQGYDRYEFMSYDWDGEKIVSRFKDCLNDLLPNKPFFAYLHFMTVHQPYYKKTIFRGLYTPFKGTPQSAMGFLDLFTRDDVTYTTAIYDEDINTVDGQIGDILSSLKTYNALQNTLVIVTSDHGEELFDHQGLGHGTTVYAEQINTFFVLWATHLLAPRKISQKVRALDFFPTILELAGVRPETEDIDGQSLIPLIRGKTLKEPSIISELGDKKAIILGDWKYIYNPFLKTEELYNEKADPRESINQVDRELGQRRMMRSLIAETCEKTGLPPSLKTGISDNVRKQLQSLGYLGGNSTTSKTKGHPKLKRSEVADQIDISEAAYNPLQLVFGWKKREVSEGPGSKEFYRIGPYVRFVLKRQSLKQTELVLEGIAETRKLQGEVQKIFLYADGEFVGNAILREDTPFSLKFKISEERGINRPLEFVLLCEKSYLGNDDKGEEARISLIIYKIFFQ